MTRRQADLRNAAGAFLTLCAAIAVMLPHRDDPERTAAPPPVAFAGAPLEFRAVSGPDGSEVQALVDASGTAVPPDDYRRIVAGSTVAREVLIELVEPGQLIAVVDYDLDAQPDAHRFAGIERIPSAKDIEPMLALAPDLVVVHGMGNPARLQRMRDAGLRVLDLGTMRGRSDFDGTVRRLGYLLGVPERAARLLTVFDRRFAAVAADIAPKQRKTAMYASPYGDRVFGGTRGSSFYDVLSAAGLIDVAAEDFEGWPRYAPEDLMMLDPEIIVTPAGQSAAVCALPGAASLRACQNGRSGVVEVPRHVLNTPGLSMLEAAELIREGVYGPPN